LAKLRTDGKLLFDQVPLCEEPNGLQLVQSSAIVRHLARTKGLYGKDEKEMAICDAMWEYFIDVRNSVERVRLADASKIEGMKKKFHRNRFPQSFGSFGWSPQKEWKWLFCGSSPYLC